MSYATRSSYKRGAESHDAADEPSSKRAAAVADSDERDSHAMEAAGTAPIRPPPSIHSQLTDNIDVLGGLSQTFDRSPPHDGAQTADGIPALPAQQATAAVGAQASLEPQLPLQQEASLDVTMLVLAEDKHQLEQKEPAAATQLVRDPLQQDATITSAPADVHATVTKESENEPQSAQGASRDGHRITGAVLVETASPTPEPTRTTTILPHQLFLSPGDLQAGVKGAGQPQTGGTDEQKTMDRAASAVATVSPVLPLPQRNQLPANTPFGLLLSGDAPRLAPLRGTQQSRLRGAAVHTSGPSSHTPHGAKVPLPTPPRVRGPTHTTAPSQQRAGQLQQRLPAAQAPRASAPTRQAPPSASTELYNQAPLRMEMDASQQHQLQQQAQHMVFGTDPLVSQYA